MSLILVAVISFAGIILGKLLFRKWFNHLMLYCIIFGGAVFLYELKLLPYVNINSFTWFVMISSFLCFLLGIFTIISARNLRKPDATHTRKTDFALKIFIDDGKTLKYTIIFLSIISLYSAIEFWMVLIKEFGSIPAVLLNGKTIYRLNIGGKLHGTTPYIFLIGYIAVFFVGIYTAFKRKFTLLTFLPLFSVVLREIAGAGRAGMLLALMEFAFSFLLFRHLLNNDPSHRFAFSKGNAFLASIILIAFFVAAASFVRISRGSDDSSKYFSGADRGLMQTKNNFIISPSVYLYASCDIGVLSKYLESSGENTGFGHNTFLPFYLFLTKLNVIKRPTEFQKGYYIPMWANTGTYLRELHADFGIVGVFLGPYLIGLIITWLWFKFYEGKSMIVFAFLVYFFLIVGFSFLLMVTRFFHWTVNLSLILIMIPVLEIIASLVKGKTVKQ